MKGNRRVSLVLFLLYPFTEFGGSLAGVALEEFGKVGFRAAMQQLGNLDHGIVFGGIA